MWISAHLPLAISAASLGLACAALVISYRTHKKQQQQRHRASPFTLPRRIILIRHAESQGNVSEDAYHTTPDPKVALSKLGREQAEQLGQRLRETIPAGTPVWVYCSCYLRARETAQIALRQLEKEGQVKRVREDPRLREQEFCGTFQQSHSPLPFEERNKYSKFFFRWDNGESAADVYDRVSLFTQTMWRDFSSPEFASQVGDGGVVLIFTHGLTSRIFLMNWLHWVFEEFDRSVNPGNCDMLEIRRPHGNNDASAPPGRVLYEMTPDTRRILFHSEAHTPRGALLRDSQNWRKSDLKYTTADM